MIAFDSAPGLSATESGRAMIIPQQLHIDFDVTDLEAGEQAVLAIGGTMASLNPVGRTLGLPRSGGPPLLSRTPPLRNP